jgi:peptidoglycan/LPS O-acetylase OafA/YrhL
LWWAPIERGGLGGVILFFALSGFLLYLPWLRASVEDRPPPRFRSYAIRRCLRIMPAYYFSVIALALLRVLVGGRDPIGFPALLLHFLFLPTLLNPLQTVYWTLQVEEYFYWLLPLLHGFVTKRGPVLLLCVAVAISVTWAVVGWFAVAPRWFPIWLEETPFFLPAFALGILSAVRWRESKESARTILWLGVVGYIALAPLALYATRAFDNDQITPVTEVLMAPAASAVVFGVARSGSRFLEHPIMRFLGAISFSLYLWHMVVIKVAPVPHAIAHVFVARALYTTLLTVPVALASYLFVERPFLRLRPTHG